MTWERATLGEVADVLRGVTYKKEHARDQPFDGAVPLLRATNIGSSIELDGGLVYVPSTVVRASQLLAEGDIVLASSSGSISVVGKSARLSQSWRGTFGAFCAVVRSSERIDSRFLALFLQSFEVRTRWSDAARGTNINNLKRGDLVSTPVPVPPLEEQRRIVAILEDHLSRLDAAEASLGKAARRLVALERAALDFHFGGNGTAVALDELVADISAGKSFGSSNAAASAKEWGIIKVSAMTWGEFRAGENKAVPAGRIDSRFEIKQGDLLVSRANTADYVGASVLVGEVRPRLLLSDKSLRVTPQAGVDSRWLWRALQAPSARAQITALATGTKDSMRNISQASLLKVRVPRCDEGAQRGAIDAFDRISDSIAATKSVIAVQQKRSTALRRSLLAAAFSGRLTGSGPHV